MTRSYKKYKPRINVIIAATIFSWLCLSLRLFQIQILNGAEYKSAVLLQSQRKHVSMPERGNFFDRDNRPLSRNIFHYTLFANPKQINDKLGLAKEISGITNKPIDIYLKKFNSKSSFESLKSFTIAKINVGIVKLIKNFLILKSFKDSIIREIISFSH